MGHRKDQNFNIQNNTPNNVKPPVVAIPTEQHNSIQQPENCLCSYSFEVYMAPLRLSKIKESNQFYRMLAS